MKLPILLLTIIIGWCILGSVVLGVGVLVYPAAWAAVAGLLYGLHRIVSSGNSFSQRDRQPSSATSLKLTPDQGHVMT